MRHTRGAVRRERTPGQASMSGAFASVSRRGVPLPSGIRYKAQLPFFARSSVKSGLPTIQRSSGDHAMRAEGPPPMRKSDSFRSPPPVGEDGVHDRPAAGVVAKKRDLLPIGRPDGKRIRSGIGRQSSYVRRPDGLHVDVVVVLSLSVPGERHLRAVWRKRRRDFETIQGRQLHDLHGGRRRQR